MDGYEDGWIGHVMGNWNQKGEQLCFGFYGFDMVVYLPCACVLIMQKC